MSLLDDIDIERLERDLPLLPPAEKLRLLELLEERDRLRHFEVCRQKFIPFVKHVWPGFIPGAHHNIMGEAFEGVADGSIRRLIINMPPRFTKSELTSWLLPAWLFGKFPDTKIIQASNTDRLASGFGRRVRNLISGEEARGEQRDPYHEVFPELRLAKDSQAADLWHTNEGGEYIAIGVGGKITGKGANCAYFSCKCLTRRGMVPIADVRVGEEVRGHDHRTGQDVWTRVEAISTQRKTGLVSVGRFIGTSEHLVYTPAGYVAAGVLAAHGHADVLALRQGVRTDGQGTSAQSATARQARRSQGVLFSRVPAQFARSDMRLWPAKGGARQDVSDLLPREQARRDDLHTLRAKILTHAIRVQEIIGSIWRRGKEFLQQRLLRQFSSAAATTGSGATEEVPGVRHGHYRQQEILLDGLLHQTRGAQEYALLRELGSAETTRSGAVQRSMRDVRSSEESCAGAPYRPQLQEPCCGEPGVTLRTVSRILSSCDEGRCARDFEDSIPGDGEWVVDLQTDTSNFYCEGILVHNCLIIDDPHSEQEAKNAEGDPAVFEGVYDWYTSGPRQRLQPGGSIILVMTRWGRADLTGKVLKKEAEERAAGSPFYDKWKVIDLPAILDEDTPKERSMWPGFWPLEALKATKSSLPVSKWQAQYQQNPTSEQGAILKRDYWRIWGNSERFRPPGSMHMENWHADRPPACHYVLQSWDTAFTKNERSDYTACTTWGVFEAEDPNTGRTVNHIILLDAFKKRMEFPELKATIKAEYKRRAPDTLLVESKGSGISLLQELRAMNVPVEGANFGRGAIGEKNDKIARANGVVDIFASGYVWAPSRRFAEEVIEECGEFPNGEHDDFVDSVVHALRRFRTGNFVGTINDELDDEDEDAVPLRRGRYY